MHPFFDEIRYFVNFQVNMGLQNEVGRKGEQIAVQELLKQGYVIRERNYRFDKAEIDILASKGETLAIVEVKMRSAGQLDPLHVSVNSKKRERLIKAADHYVVKNDLDVEVRFDIIQIVYHKNRFILEHLEGAFSPF